MAGTTALPRRTQTVPSGSDSVSVSVSVSASVSAFGFVQGRGDAGLHRAGVDVDAEHGTAVKADPFGLDEGKEAGLDSVAEDVRKAIFEHVRGAEAGDGAVGRDAHPKVPARGVRERRDRAQKPGVVGRGERFGEEGVGEGVGAGDHPEPLQKGG